jgi:hypothetical protein
LLDHAARRPDGTYRVVAGRLIPGRIIGNFRYQGTRPDDPNDLVPHEHRRELRGLFVFGAWTNMTDFKAKNTIDTVLTENGHAVVKHYLQDVGSTFGMANEQYQWDNGWEHFYDGGIVAKRLASFGLRAESLGDGQVRPKGRRSGNSKVIGSIRERGRPTRPTPPQSRCGTTMRSGPRGASPPSATT